jgi:hypothetical protein
MEQPRSAIPGAPYAARSGLVDGCSPSPAVVQRTMSLADSP